MDGYLVRFVLCRTAGTAFAMYSLKPANFKEYIMKYETLMLQALFSACLLVCVLTLGAMITSHPSTSVTSTAHQAASVATAR